MENNTAPLDLRSKRRSDNSNGEHPAAKRLRTTTNNPIQDYRGLFAVHAAVSYFRSLVKTHSVKSQLDTTPIDTSNPEDNEPRTPNHSYMTKSTPISVPTSILSPPLTPKTTIGFAGSSHQPDLPVSFTQKRTPLPQLPLTFPVSQEVLDRVFKYHPNMVRRKPSRELSPRKQLKRLKNNASSWVSRRMQKLRELTTAEQYRTFTEINSHNAKDFICLAKYLNELIQMGATLDFDYGTSNDLKQLVQELHLSTLESTISREDGMERSFRSLSPCNGDTYHPFSIAALLSMN